MPQKDDGLEFALSPLAIAQTILLRRSTRNWLGRGMKEIEEERVVTNIPTVKLLSIPAGKFKMGSPESERDHQDNENQVDVTISHAFWLAETQFTQAQWKAVMRNNPSQRRGDNLPVENVSSEDCEACLAELNGMLKDKLPAGYRFALPTEAQWEYACRSGTATAFYYGDILDITRANFGEDFPLFRGGKDGYVEKTRPVKSYQPNDWGLYDMHGNVWEWCADWYSDKLLGGTDPTGPNTGSGRVVRGGSWDYGREWCRSAYRAWIAPDVRSARLGFRAAVSVA